MIILNFFLNFQYLRSSLWFCLTKGKEYNSKLLKKLMSEGNSSLVKLPFSLMTTQVYILFMKKCFNFNKGPIVEGVC